MSKNQKVVIFSDDDGDGLCSARIIYDYLKGVKIPVETPLFQKWDIFGITDDDIKAIVALDPTDVFILDIGSDYDALTKAKFLLDLGIKVTMFDNHPPEEEIIGKADYKKYLELLAEMKENKSFEYDSTRDNCTTGLCYMYVKRNTPDFGSDAIDKWTMIGLTADVATKSAQGGVIMKELFEKHPYLTGGFLYEGKGYYGKSYSFKWGVLDFYAQLLHVPRRIKFDEATQVAFEAMGEMETIDNWVYIYRAIDKAVAPKEGSKSVPSGGYIEHLSPFKNKYPSLYAILCWNLDWRTNWKKVYQTRGNIAIFDYEGFSVSVISHGWNLGSALCVPPNTFLMGDNKLISEYREGETVFGKKGKVKIEQTFMRPYKGEMIKIYADGILPFEVTPEHPILVKRNRHITNVISGFQKEVWKPASSINPKVGKKDGDYLVVPRLNGKVAIKSLCLKKYNKRPELTNTLKTFPLNEDTAWLLGLYVAEGSMGHNCPLISLNKNERVIIDKVRKISNSLGFSTNIVKSSKSNGISVRITSHILGRAFDDWCGHGAKNKQIPEWVLLHKSQDIVKSFFDGYIAGDGSIEKGSGRGRATTVSKTLAYQLQLLGSRLGFTTTIQHTCDSHKGLIMGRVVNLSDTFTFGFHKDIDKKSHIKIQETSVLHPIRRVEKISYDDLVYNIATADGSYLINNAISHNCNVKSSSLKKPHFCINDTTTKGIHISGRADHNSLTHVGKVFRACDPSILEGGGIKEAGSAQAKVSSVELILNELVRVATKVYNEEKDKLVEKAREEVTKEEAVKGTAPTPTVETATATNGEATDDIASEEMI